MPPGRLVLVPAWLSESSPVEAVLSAAVLERIRGLRTFVVEDAKSARRFLAACAHPGPIRELSIRVLDEHTPLHAVPELLAPLREGMDMGLLSDAGLPAVADPGAQLVAAAHAEGFAIVPLPGPSSILLALMASGLDGQRFRFVGYLPANSTERVACLAELEERSIRRHETQIFIETPYRNDALLADLVKSCRPTTRLAIARDLTGPAEHVRMATVGEWRRRPPTLGKIPAVFLLLG